MFRVMLVFALLLSGCSGISYDSKAGLATISNSERNFVVDYAEGTRGALLRRCLEAPGPAALLNDFKLESGISGKGTSAAEGKIEVDVKNTESIAKLYEVSSILQYAHAMSYRLCEALLNRAIDNEEYSRKYDALATSTRDLLRFQLEVAQEQRKKAEADLRKSEVELELQKAQMTR
ncbi:MAG: hypothetical protein KC466_20605 [Myxococcales bacterium]|nr:hypothetical protein [Myxococcales bacterium]